MSYSLMRIMIITSCFSDNNLLRPIFTGDWNPGCTHVTVTCLEVLVFDHCQRNVRELTTKLMLEKNLAGVKCFVITSHSLYTLLFVISVNNELMFDSNDAVTYCNILLHSGFVICYLCTTCRPTCVITFHMNE